MTRLTQEMRDAFVRRVMNDVPKIDYDSQAESFATRMATELLPPAIMALWRNPEMREWVKMVEIGAYDTYRVSVPGFDSAQLSELVMSEFGRLYALDEAQDEARVKLRNSIMGVAKLCRTTEALEKRLPELTKYLPQNEEAVTFPVATNIIAEMSKMGWPAKRS